MIISIVRPVFYPIDGIGHAILALPIRCRRVVRRHIGANAGRAV
ncbi:MAG: hypothetical protein OJF62_002488 [Pseudolabrys sp.]|nr:hypothetical protein [Pseudolabrys sp.]